MASMTATKSSFLARFLRESVFPARALAASHTPLRSSLRSFNTSAQMLDLEDESDVEVDRRRHYSRPARRASGDFDSFFRDVFVPIYPSRNLSKVLGLADLVPEGPPATRISRRRNWDAREDDKGLHLRFDMPGVDKEGVNVKVEKNTLVIKGECGKEGDSEDGGASYGGSLDLPADVYNIEQIRAEMKNGVLKLFVPKVKEEERKDVFEVKIQ